MDKPNLAVQMGPLQLKNPVLTASGTFGYGREFASIVNIDQLGGLWSRASPKSHGRQSPTSNRGNTLRHAERHRGLANVGLDVFLAEKMPWLQTLDTHVIVNIYGHSIQEYGTVAAGLSGVSGISALEVNISCPNVEQGGMAFGTDPLMAAKVTETVLQKTDKPVIVKLSPNVTDIGKIARAVESAGAHAVSLINTLTGMVIDVQTRKPKLANGSGGLSGPAIRPVALHMVRQVVQCVQIPVIGMGGIMETRDALAFLIAGASAVQVGTASFVNPSAALEIVQRESKIS